MTDEPPLESDRATQAVSAVALRQLAERIARLVHEQPYAILCTQGQSQPYGSLVALAVTDDLTSAVFATPVSTRKYRLLTERERVALVVDDRPDHPDELMRVEAVTVTGKAREVEPGPARERYAQLVVARHPQLATFVAATSTALFRVSVARFLHVTRFQEVRQWVPTDHPT